MAINHKVFKKIFKDLLKNDPNSFTTLKKLSSKDIVMFKDQVNKCLDDFIGCKESCLSSITLLKDVKYSINWDILHNMYFSTFNPEEIPKDIVERSKNERNPVNKVNPVQETSELQGLPDLAGLLNSPMLGNIISAILPVVQDAIKDKDLQNINPQELMSGLMSKDPSKCGGLDINKLLQDSAEKLKNL